LYIPKIRHYTDTIRPWTIVYGKGTRHNWTWSGRYWGAVYAEKGVCPCLHAVHTLMHVITTRYRRGTNVLWPCSTRYYPLKLCVLPRVTTSQPRP
jgi:hypothetical protein